MPSSSDWYLDDAIRLLGEAKTKKGKRRRSLVSVAIRQLISFLVGRHSPRKTATSTTDDPVCDYCFRKLRNPKGPVSLEQELCSGCHKIKRNEEAKQDMLFISSREADIQLHRERVEKELQRLGITSGDGE